MMRVARIHEQSQHIEDSARVRLPSSTPGRTWSGNRGRSVIGAKSGPPPGSGEGRRCRRTTRTSRELYSLARPRPP